MLSRLSFFSFAASLLLLSHPAHTQQSDDTATNNTGAPLQPVLPPSGDADDFAILKPSSSQTLFLGGASNSAINKRSDGNNAILVDAAFDFLFPTVPLDHSSSIADVFCSNGNTMTGTFSSASAYAFSKEIWTNSSNILFITSAAGCGDDNENGHFLAQDIYFSDDTLSFTAVGKEHSIEDVASQVTITWDNSSPGELKKRHYSNLTKRVVSACPQDSCTSSSNLGMGVDFRMADQEETWPVSANVPWSNANRLFSDDGLTYDCVDCGFQTDFQVTGTITLNFVDQTVTSAQISLSGTFDASLFVGITTAGPVHRTWAGGLFSATLPSFSVGSLTTVGVTFVAAAQINVNIQAAGQLLAGASSTQQNLQATLDLLNPGSSYARGSPPTLQTRAEVGTPMDGELTLNLPIQITVDVSNQYWPTNKKVILDTTPSIETFIFSEGDCSQGNQYIHVFDNGVNLYVVGDDGYSVVDGYSISHYANQLPGGCIPVAQDPTTPDPTTTGMTCVNDLPFGTPPAGTSCGLKGYYPAPPYHPPIIGKPRRNVATPLDCATLCNQTTDCLSVMHNAGKHNCFLYSASVADIPIKIPKRPDAVHQWWDIACWPPCFD